MMNFCFLKNVESLSYDRYGFKSLFSDSVRSFRILITINLALIYSFCFEDTVFLSIPIKRDNFYQTPLYNSGVTRFES